MTGAPQTKNIGTIAVIVVVLFSFALKVMLLQNLFGRMILVVKIS